MAWICLSGLLVLLGISLFGRKKRHQDQEKQSLMTPPLYDRALAWLTNEEGLQLKPYPDGEGFSIGIGHYIQPNEKSLMNGITKDVAIRLFNTDLEKVDRAIDRLVKVSITDNQKLALASFAFNIGIGDFEDSTLLKELNAGNYSKASLQFPVWNKSKDRFGILRVNPVLVKRRLREQLLFRS